MKVELMGSEPDVWMLAGRVLIAAMLGAALGLEREWRGKEAGLRTNTLIAIGAALFTAVSIMFQTSPDRIAAQVVTGVGFLGAGAIMRNGTTIQGLTTAAMIWVNAAVGVAVGAGFVRLAVATTVIVLAAMVLLTPLDRLLDRRRPGRSEHE
ncbi:MAG: MgtC/SapB family protein [Acidobacteriota bacterium]|nr:MgtC/SapB family protein [Acidobacteriota bacterium]